MRVLVVTGSNLKKNESAVLSHIAFIQGFCDCGCDVTVISNCSNAGIEDDSLELPSTVHFKPFESSRIYRFISQERKDSINFHEMHVKKKQTTRLYTFARDFVKRLYGAYGFNRVWIHRVVKQFKDKKPYDLMVSISTPPEGHEAAYRLRKKGNITCKVFCEIWEDPWQLDIYKDKPQKRLLKKEETITSYADKVLYVSPITLKIQKEQFQKTASKMDWVPLASYYSSKREVITGFHYGYFGAFFPSSRNLTPFYEAAKKAQLDLVICGSPEYLFPETETIQILPRLPLKQLQTYEDKTNVLVFVCNLRGGQIPGKIYQYAATNKKILFILDGTEEEKKILKEFFARYNRFYFCENTVEDILKTISFLEKDKTISSEPLHDFDPSVIAKQIFDKCGLSM